MKLPIGHVEYEVRVVPRLKVHGDCDTTKRLIRVRKEAHRRIERSHIVHEAIHCWLFEMGYDELAQDEAFVEGLAQWWMLMRERAPWL